MSAADVVLLDFQRDWARRETNEAAREFVVTMAEGMEWASHTREMIHPG